MLGWLWRKLIGSFYCHPPCNHEWIQVNCSEYKRFCCYRDDWINIGTIYHLRCKKCGDMKFVKFEI